MTDDPAPRRGNPNFLPLSEERTVSVSARLPESLRDALRTLPGGSDSERLRRLVLEAVERRGER